MSPYTCLLVFGGLLVQSTLAVISSDFQQTVDGILYRYAGRTNSYSMAEKECHKNGGHLAKITMDLLSHLSTFMSSIYEITHDCSWIGMTDVAREGDWRWFDGTPVTSVRWGEQNWFSRMSRNPSKEDCGKLCRSRILRIGNYKWRWDSTTCADRDLHTFCQYDVSNVTQATTQTTPKSPIRRKDHSRKDARKEVIVQTDEHFYITGLKPVVDKRVPMVTTCARLCKGKCRYTNYNDRTGHCRGYGDGELTGKKDTNWQLWVTKEVSAGSP